MPANASPAPRVSMTDTGVASIWRARSLVEINAPFSPKVINARDESD